MKLLNKKILLGITGGIASYKTPDLVRLLVKSGAEVRVITTRSALDFVSPLALSVVSKHKVYTEFIEDNQWQSHIELGLWADLMLIAPATAHTISKMANGLCDNLLIATYLSARCPVVIAPAMDLDMFKHPSTQHNLSILNNAGCRFIGPEDGELASGLSGIGRMTEPLVIVDEIESIFASKNSLGGIRVVVTAGPTREAIDPVRFISNHSSGKMGYALALEAYERGAIVQLIRGKGANDFSHEGINIINVESSDEMALESAKA